ncbi:MAG: uracil-DNA glycosylase [Anaerolineae bacterium]|nr:MAG: uracil-DNA glycosylase [Anaerolineae bacterium]
MPSPSLTSLASEIVSCRRCPRLVAWREEVARTKRRAYRDWDYWGRPVPGFGDPGARVMVVGLAPGAHGSNRTGRQFTGDGSGDFLYPALYRAGFASQPRSISRDDGLTLTDMYITAVGRCAPPGNKPTAEELDNCQPFLERELEIVRPEIVVCLGRVAFERVKRICAAHLFGADDRRAHRAFLASMPFAHGALYDLQDAHSPAGHSPAACSPRWLLASYHPSRQNTQTGRLTVEMFDAVWETVRRLLRERE